MGVVGGSAQKQWDVVLSPLLLQSIIYIMYVCIVMDTNIYTSTRIRSNAKFTTFVVHLISFDKVFIKI